MFRILGLLALMGLALAALLVVIGAAMRPAPRRAGGELAVADPLPRTIRRVSYIALVVVMFGVTTGLLGGA